MATSSGLLQPVISWLAFHLKIFSKRSLFQKVSEGKGEVEPSAGRFQKKKTTQKRPNLLRPAGRLSNKVTTKPHFNCSHDFEGGCCLFFLGFSDRIIRNNPE